MTWPVSTLWPSRPPQKGHEGSLTNRVTLIIFSHVVKQADCVFFPPP